MKKKTKRKYTRRKLVVETSAVFTSDQMLQVFDELDNILDATLMPYTYLGEFARALKEGSLDISGTEYQVAIMRKDYSNHGFDILKYHIPELTRDDTKIHFKIREVPITISIIEKDYGFLTRPDFKFFYTSNCRILNPFDEYWKIRALL